MNACIGSGLCATVSVAGFHLPGEKPGLLFPFSSSAFPGVWPRVLQYKAVEWNPGQTPGSLSRDGGFNISWASRGKSQVWKGEVFTGDTALFLQDEDGIGMFSCCEEHRAGLLAMEREPLVGHRDGHQGSDRGEICGVMALLKGEISWETLTRAQWWILHNVWGWKNCRSYQRAPKSETGAWPRARGDSRGYRRGLRKAATALWECQGRGDLLRGPGGLQGRGEKIETWSKHLRKQI